MNILWNCFEILINILQAIIITYVIKKLLTERDVKHKALLFHLNWFFLALIITIFNYITVFEGLASIIYIISVLPYAIYAFHGNIVKKIIVCTIPFVLIFIITTLVLNMFSVMNNTTLIEIVTEESVNRLIAVLSIQLAFYFFCQIVIRIFGDYSKEYKFRAKEWSIVVVTLLLSVVITMFLHYSSISVTDIHSRIYINLSIFAMLLLNIVILHLVNNMLQNTRYQYENELLKTRADFQKQYIDNTDFHYETIRKIRHDIKNQFSVISQLAKNGDNEELIRFIEESKIKNSPLDSVINTDNKVVNSIINSKLTMASSLGIKSSCISIKSFEGIDDIDLCNILSNMLDNAITACINITDKIPKTITVEIRKEDSCYNFLVMNTIKESVLKTNPELNTTKANTSEHGLGIIILREIAEKYNGRLNFYEEDNYFCADLSIIA